MLTTFFRKRKRFYCVGSAKSGTHSISSMFNNKVKTQHEADSEEVIEKILELIEGKTSEQEIRSYIRERDERLRLEIDSSQLNFFLLKYLVEEFPDARFLLTIRDCYTWLDSFINDSLRRDTSENWMKLRDVRFRANEFDYQPEENILKELSLYTLDGYLSYWAHHNSKVLETVPEERLLVIKTNEISGNAESIADFAGISRTKVLKNRTHSFKNPAKYEILEKINQDFLEDKVNFHCSNIMGRFFPEIHSIDDAFSKAAF